MLAEQAIFTSARTSRLDGYQVVAHSEGVSEEDLHEIAQWGPTHDSLSNPSTRSINFHRMQSGNHCVSQTVAAGDEYSGRRGPRIETRCLLIPEPLAAKFGHHPLRMFEAAAAKGSFAPADLQQKPQPVRLAGRSSVFNRSLIAKVVSEVGPRPLVHLLDALINHQCVAINDVPRTERIVDALINLVPAECRSQLSFATGLRHSARRPYRCQCTHEDTTGLRRVAQRGDLEVIHWSQTPPGLPHHPWAAWICHQLEHNEFAKLSSVLSEARPGLQLEDLANLAAELGEVPDSNQDPTANTCSVAPSQPSVQSPPQRGDHSGRALEGQLLDVLNGVCKGSPGCEQKLRDLLSRIAEIGDPAVITQVRLRAMEHLLSSWQANGKRSDTRRAVATVEALAMLQTQLSSGLVELLPPALRSEVF